MGYSDMDKKPFDPLTLVSDGYDAVQTYINENPELRLLADRTTSFLSGFYSDFALELLSTIDYISNNENTLDETVISQKLNEWNDRKKSMFSNSKYISISINHLKSHLLQS